MSGSVIYGSSEVSSRSICERSSDLRQLRGQLKDHLWMDHRFMAAQRLVKGALMGGSVIYGSSEVSSRSICEWSSDLRQLRGQIEEHLQIGQRSTAAQRLVKGAFVDRSVIYGSTEVSQLLWMDQPSKAAQRLDAGCHQIL